MLGQKHDLTHVIGVVRHLPVDGLRYGMRLRANRDLAFEISIGELRERVEEILPAALPQRHQLRARLGRVVEFCVAMTVRLLAVGGEKVRPARAQVAGQMLHQDGDGVGLRVEGHKEAGVRTLSDGLVTQLFVVAEEVSRIFHVGGGELVRHVGIFPPHPAQKQGIPTRRLRLALRAFPGRWPVSE